MRPPLWQPSIALSPEETAIVRRIHRAKLFIFLREQRHTLFSPDFQAELGALLYEDKPKGHPPTPPAQLALATILQAYTGVSDDEVIEATTMDRRWQLVLDCLDCAEPPFSKATLVAFRQRLIAHEGDRRLIERTLEVAQDSGAFSPKALRVALDSSPLWGAGKVEDTYNLVGHALRKALSVVARQQGRGLADVAADAGAAVVGGPVSLKAALDLDWDDPEARTAALGAVLGALDALDAWLAGRPAGADSAVQTYQAAAEQVRTQDIEVAPDGMLLLRHGVSRDRRISLEDEQMRHGRKSRSVRVDGYKRHVLHDLQSGLVCAVGVTAANAPEASVTEALDRDLEANRLSLADLSELHLDRGYLSSRWVQERPATLAIYCKAWPVRNGAHFPKTTFTLDWPRQRIRCPAAVELPFTPGGTVHFPAAICAVCALRERCTTSARGRSVHLHPDERFLAELRQRQHTPAGRAKLRERIAVEHTLAHVGHWQGRRARYRGSRKNLFDLRRCAVVDNLHVLRRLYAQNERAA
ncbi:MAG: IS1182 family transposase [Ktedonobacterales bacterium]